MLKMAPIKDMNPVDLWMIAEQIRATILDQPADESLGAGGLEAREHGESGGHIPQRRESND